MNFQDLLDKAERAAESAKILLKAGDVDGACNRAYYAMFDAARAALLLKNPSVPLETIKTHGGLITSFSMHLVKTKIVTVELGKTLNKAEDLRLIADYKGDSIEVEQAEWVVKQAAIFINAMKDLA